MHVYAWMHNQFIAGYEMAKASTRIIFYKGTVMQYHK